MSSHELTKKCPYDGCDFVSASSSTLALENNVASHVSNSHRGITTIWYGGSKVTVHRDVKFNCFTCPCGDFASTNAASLRRHARNLHKNMTTATPRTSKPAQAVASKPEADKDGMYRILDPNPKDKLDIGGGEVWIPTGPTVVHKAYPLVAMTPMGPPSKSISARASASTSASPSSKGASSSISTSISKSIASALASPARPIPTAGPSTSRSVSSKRKTEEPTPGLSKVRRIDNAPSVSSSTAVARSSKAVAHTPLSKPLVTSAPFKLKTSVAVSSGPASTSKKRPADESLPERSSSKLQRVGNGPAVTEKKKTTKPAKPTQSAAPLKTPDVSARKIAITKEDGKNSPPKRPAGNAPPLPTTASTVTVRTPAKALPKPRPIVKPSPTLAKAPASPSKAEPQKHVRPPPAAGVAASSASSGYSTSTHGSSSSSSARTSATPAPDRAGPSSGTSRKCSDCGGQIDASGKNGMCTMCYIDSLLSKKPPTAPLSRPQPQLWPQRCVTCGSYWPTKSGECAKCQLDALGVPDVSSPEPEPTSSSFVGNGDSAPIAIAVAAAPNPGPKASPYPKPIPKLKLKLKPIPVPVSKPKAAKQPKPRKKGVSKAARQLEFQRWLAKWTAARRARARAASNSKSKSSKGRVDHGKDGAEDGDGDEGEEDKTNWWRVQTTRNQGGVCYATPEAFFSALEAVLAGHRRRLLAKDDGKGKGAGNGGVLTFYGGYSIVAQPGISAIARLDMLVDGMERLGFRLDGALQGRLKFQYKSSPGTVDEVYKYPCTCGGTPPPVGENEMRHAHRIPDEKYAGEVCGGTIMLMVGEDNARLAYGIQGQRIAVDIVH